MSRLILSAALLLGLLACSDADRAKIMGNGARHHVVQYSGGQKVGEWTSTGRVQNESKSDGYFFNDLKTGRLVRVTGTVMIETL